MPKKIIILIIIFLTALSLFSAKAFLNYKKTKNLEASKAKAQEVKVTIIEGWDLGDISDFLEKKALSTKQDFKKALQVTDTKKFSLLNLRPKNSSLEGYLFPDTYSVYSPDKTKPQELATELIKKALENFSQKFTPEMELRAKSLQMTVHEILTLASIIEKETGRNINTETEQNQLDTERKTVAGIFYNRLNIGMALESDATINYVTGKNNPTPTLSELEAESAYNTYKNKGLPPGPICNPSLSSIKAALYPNKTDYFYFLHKQPSGEVVFSKTYEEHLQNKYRYLK